MNVVAWAAYAGMRAEVVAVESGTRSLTRYAMAIAAIEALGAAVAATLPLGSAEHTNVAAVVAVTAVYAASLLPQFACARRAQVQPGRQPPPGGLMGGTALRAALTAQRLRRRRHAGLPRPQTARALVGGGVLMLIASGPASLGVALAAELDGHLAVVGCAITFTAGCLLAPVVAQRLDRLRLPTRVAWPMLGVGMLAGWVIAPWQIAGLLTAQFLSGLAMTAFTGEMDARVAERAEPGRVTSLLAWAAASRATGSAVAVRVIPLIVAARSIGLLSFAAIGVLVVGATHAARGAGVDRAASCTPPSRVVIYAASGQLRLTTRCANDHSRRCGRRHRLMTGSRFDTQQFIHAREVYDLAQAFRDRVQSEALAVQNGILAPGEERAQTGGVAERYAGAVHHERSRAVVVEQCPAGFVQADPRQRCRHRRRDAALPFRRSLRFCTRRGHGFPRPASRCVASPPP